MSTELSRFKHYILPRGRQPILDSLPYDELGEAVLAQFNERFRGVREIEDPHEYKPGEPISFSNIPKALGMTNILMKETKGRIRLLHPFEVVRYWGAIPDKPGTYADTLAVSVFPKLGPNEELRKRVLEILGFDPSRLETPFIVTGLDVEKADNNYGFSFIESDHLPKEAIQAPFLQEDQRVRYDPKTKTLVPTNDDTGVYILTASEQSGLRRACRSWSGNLDFRNGDVLNSSSSGRVDVVQDPMGRTENLG